MKTTMTSPRLQPWRWLYCLLLCVLVSGCGGGSENGDTGPSDSRSPSTGSETTGPVTLTWEAPNQNADDTCLADLSGYRIYQGTSIGNYTVAETVLVNALSCAPSGMSNACGTIQTCNYTLYNVPSGTWYFAVQAFDATNEGSAYSNVVSKTIR